MIPTAPLFGCSVVRGSLYHRMQPFTGPVSIASTRRFSGQVTATTGSVSKAAGGEPTLYAPYIVKEVPPPRGGSPIYWSFRRWLFKAKTDMMRIPRQIRWNVCIVRASFGGVPKQSYDPKMNQWVKLMDNEEWGGIGGRLWINISNNILFNMFLAFVLYTCYFRIIANNKHNVFAKWAHRDEEEEDDDE